MPFFGLPSLPFQTFLFCAPLLRSYWYTHTYLPTGEHVHFKLFLRNLVMVWWKGDTIWKTIYGNFVRKVFELYGVYTLTMDVFKPVMIAIGFFYWTFWATLALSSMAIALRFVFGAFLMPSYCISRFCCGFVSTSKSERIRGPSAQISVETHTQKTTLELYICR